MLEKLTCGVLHVSGATGLRFVRPTLWERIRLIWLFRNFRILQQHVLSHREQKWLTKLYSGRMGPYRSAIERQLACVIGTIIISESAGRIHDERRLAPRLPLPFDVRYGAGRELMYGEGCDLSETGLAFVGPRAYAPGDEITVHFRLGANPRDIWARTRAIVRNCSGRRMGVEFCIIHPRDRAQLRELTRERLADSESVESVHALGDGIECDPVGHLGSPSPK